MYVNSYNQFTVTLPLSIIGDMNDGQALRWLNRTLLHLPAALVGGHSISRTKANWILRYWLKDEAFLASTHQPEPVAPQPQAEAPKAKRTRRAAAV